MLDKRRVRTPSTASSIAPTSVSEDGIRRTRSGTAKGPALARRPKLAEKYPLFTRLPPHTPEVWIYGPPVPETVLENREVTSLKASGEEAVDADGEQR